MGRLLRLRVGLRSSDPVRPLARWTVGADSEHQYSADKRRSSLRDARLLPQAAERVRDAFADVLATDAGLLAQFYVTARLLHRVDKNDHPDLAAPLRRHVDSL